MSDVDDLEAKVARMRALGVVEWGNIKLGPPIAPPVPEVTLEQFKERLAKQAIKQRDIMFAASASRPALKKVPK